MGVVESLIDQLQALGFSQYEAQAYIALLEENPANGYELAKRSGVPRPNIYLVMQKLEQRGAVLRLMSPDGTHYSPLSPKDLISRLKHQYQGLLDETLEGLEHISKPPTPEYTLNLHSYSSLVESARSLMDSAQNRLLLIIWPAESMALAQAIMQAGDRGIPMLTLCMNGCPQPCSSCRGEIFRYHLTPPDHSRWLILIRDGEEVLAGEILPDGDALAIRTRQKMMVKLAEEYIQHSIALAQILSDLGSRFGGDLDPRSLTGLDVLQDPNRWLDIFRQSIRGGDPRLSR